jgi:hypothetical protein
MGRQSATGFDRAVEEAQVHDLTMTASSTDLRDFELLAPTLIVVHHSAIGGID